jgi:dTDP-4-dehydrorhamnose reductase
VPNVRASENDSRRVGAYGNAVPRPKGGLALRPVHVVNSGSASKLELPRYIEGHLSTASSRVRSVVLEDLRLSARLSRNSFLLDTQVAGLLGPMRPWNEAIRQCLES